MVNLAGQVCKALLDDPSGDRRVVGFTLPGFQQTRNFGKVARNHGHLAIENY
jgi:hypothetical protein